MDFRGIVHDVSERVSKAVDEVLALDIAPADKEAQIALIFKQIGQEFGHQLFEQVSQVFDSTAFQSTVDTNVDAQIERLAQKLVRDSAFGISNEVLTKEYFDTVLGRAENTAFRNAKSLEKHPTLTRTMTGRETCDWCRARAGTFTDPDAELFKRHDNCDCIFKVSGFNTRNGKLKNYSKKEG